MSPFRDEELGAALSALDVPDHGEGFWTDLAARLRAEAAAGAGAPAPRAGELQGDDRLRAGRASHQRRWLASAAVAAVVALVVGAAVLVADGPERSTTGPATSTPEAPEPDGPDEAPAGVVPASLTAEVTVTLDDGRIERRFELAADRDGSRKVTELDTGELVARDIAGSEEVVVRHPDSGDRTATRRRGVAAAGPGPRAVDAVSDPPLVAHTLALAAAGDPAVTEVERLDRPAWRLETDLTPNAIGGGPDSAIVVVDQATGLLLLLEERLGDLVTRTIEVTSLATSDQPAEAGAFAVDGDAEVRDEGFERVGLDELRAGVVGDAGVVPGTVPDGFEMATVDVHPGEGDPTGPEGGNPRSVDTTVLVYRRGWEELVVTSRRTGPDPAAWDDPFRGEGQLVEPMTTTLEDGALAGTEVQVVLDPTTAPHVWGVHPDLVVTVSSSALLTPEQLVEVAASLERVG